MKCGVKPRACCRRGRHERMFADQGNTRARNARAPCRVGCSRPTPFSTRAVEEDAQALVVDQGSTRACNARAPCRAGCSRPHPLRNAFPALVLELILAVRRARVGERWGESWGAPDPRGASSSRRRLMRVVFSCVGSLKSPICRAISRSGCVCLRLPVHVPGYSPPRTRSSGRRPGERAKRACAGASRQVWTGRREKTAHPSIAIIIGGRYKPVSVSSWRPTLKGR